MHKSKFTVSMTSESYKELLEAELILEMLERFLANSEREYVNKEEIQAIIGCGGKGNRCI